MNCLHTEGQTVPSMPCIARESLSKNHDPKNTFQLKRTHVYTSSKDVKQSLTSGWESKLAIFCNIGQMGHK